MAHRYALHTGTGLLEAAGIVVPEISHCLSDSDNLRLGSLGNTSNFDNARRPPAE
ncbi:hypothetical protein [Gloeobacter kilaueensis]|uniref:hypothetical protein n=1 Tax=Gloeobacter kilaueensis TaxID=1416614 RepID=UPI00042406C5|nr:hypothetical protein [Gloeobacter kilaueensis]